MVRMTTVEHPTIETNEGIDTDARSDPMATMVGDRPGDVREVDLNEALPPRMHELLSDLVRAGGNTHRIPTTDRNELILRLRQAGATYAAIGEVMGMAVSSVHGVVHKATTKVDLHNTEQLRAELAADLRMFIDELRPWVHGVNGPFLDEKVGNMFLRAVEAYALLLGLNEPRRTQLNGPFARGGGQPRGGAVHRRPRGVDRGPPGCVGRGKHQASAPAGNDRAP